MAHRCPNAEPVGTAVLTNYQLVFRGTGGNAVATVEPSNGSEVPVLVWEITLSDEANLDRYEGFPYLYRKETVTVDLGGEPMETMVYIMNDGRAVGLPSAYYYGTIRQGYIDCGFDENCLKDAVKRAVRDRMMR